MKKVNLKVIVMIIILLYVAFVIPYIYFRNLTNKETSSTTNEEYTDAEHWVGRPDINDLSEMNLCTKEQGDSYQSEAAYFYNGDFYIFKTVLENRINDQGYCLDLIYALPEETKKEFEKYPCHDSDEPWFCENELLVGMSYSPYLYKVLLGNLYLVDVKNKSLSDVIALQDFDKTNEDIHFFIREDEPGINFVKRGKSIIGLSPSKRYLLYKIGGDVYPTDILNKEDCNGDDNCLSALNAYETFVDNNGGNGIFIMDLITDTVNKIDEITYDYYDPIEVEWLEDCDVFEFKNLLNNEALLYDAKDGKKLYSVEGII